jgi:hypothetical protein
MPDADGVLASIDACLEDYAVSEDAMRWAPDEPEPTAMSADNYGPQANGWPILDPLESIVRPVSAAEWQLCPVCCHVLASHRADGTGTYYCSRSLTEPPSCRDCLATWTARTVWRGTTPTAVIFDEIARYDELWQAARFDAWTGLADLLPSFWLHSVKFAETIFGARPTLGESPARPASPAPVLPVECPPLVFAEKAKQALDRRRRNAATDEPEYNQRRRRRNR